MSMTLKRDHHRPRFENDKVDIICICIYICQNFCRHNFNTTGFFGSYFFLQFCISSKR